MTTAATRKSLRELIRPIQSLPHDFMAGFVSERPSLIDGIRRPLTADECEGVAHCMASLLVTVQELADLAEATEDRLDSIRLRLEGIRAEHANLQSRINGLWLTSIDPDEEGDDDEEEDDEEEDEGVYEEVEEEEDETGAVPVDPSRPPDHA